MRNLLPLVLVALFTVSSGCEREGAAEDGRTEKSVREDLDLLLLLAETQLRSAPMEFSADPNHLGIELTVERYERGSLVEGPVSIGSGGSFKSPRASRVSVAASPVEPGILRFVAGWHDVKFFITHEMKLPSAWSSWNVSFPMHPKSIGKEAETLFAIWDSGSVKPTQVLVSEQITGGGASARGGFIVKARLVNIPAK
jgi:hypothetical protein